MHTILAIVGLIAFYFAVRLGGRLSDRIAATRGEWPNVFLCTGILLVYLGVMLGFHADLDLFQRGAALLPLAFAGGIAFRARQRAMND
jgi:nitrate/nitrite transporter NarK